jgi:hypothetical protein
MQCYTPAALDSTGDSGGTPAQVAFFMPLTIGRITNNW